MRLFLSMVPLNLIPIALIFLTHVGIVPRFDGFNMVIAALLIFTLAVELMKSSMFALSSGASWIDFSMSLLLLLALGGYMIYLIAQGKVIDPLLWLGLEAQALDVIAGFYIAITNARRDIGMVDN
ncbi:MAG: hypothetical protein GXO19_01940 [Epsilonproteobacteria bacterium]|nr:hypothetical protein [Campylobacterota bacterium]NPA56478.1 hypothetical protein [Campylobacterota bacterium]